VRRSLELLEELADALERDARPGVEASCADLERRRCQFHRAAGEAQPQEFINDLLERSSAPACFRFQSRRNVFFERQSRSHIKMLFL
jgi:hypothetical protein